MARYALTDVVTELRNAAGRPNGIRRLLILMEANGLPAIGGVAGSP